MISASHLQTWVPNCECFCHSVPPQTHRLAAHLHPIVTPSSTHTEALSLNDNNTHKAELMQRMPRFNAKNPTIALLPGWLCSLGITLFTATPHSQRARALTENVWWGTALDAQRWAWPEVEVLKTGRCYCTYLWHCHVLIGNTFHHTQSMSLSLFRMTCTTSHKHCVVTATAIATVNLYISRMWLVMHAMQGI